MLPERSKNTEAKAFSVATFYENFSFELKEIYYIQSIDELPCHVRENPSL